jgi:hypothetical protein
MTLPLDLWFRIKKVADDLKITFNQALSFLLEKGLDPRQA